MTIYTDSGVVLVRITPSGVDVKTGSFIDAATVSVRITPSGTEVKTGSGTDAATVYVDIRVPFLAEGDWALSVPTAVTQVAVPPATDQDGGSTDPPPPGGVVTPPTTEPVPSYNGPDDTDHGGNFIGEGLLRARFVASSNAVFNRFSATETNRFTGVLRE